MIMTYMYKTYISCGSSWSPNSAYILKKAWSFNNQHQAVNTWKAAERDEVMIAYAVV